MKKVIAIILALALQAFSQGTISGSGTIKGSGNISAVLTVLNTTVTYANNTCGFGASATTTTCTFAPVPTTGDAIIGALLDYNSSNTLTSVCDGTGTGGCTGSSSYTITSATTNSGDHFYLFYTCNYQGTNSGTITMTSTTANGTYGIMLEATGNRSSNCNDGSGPGIQNNTSAGTSCQTPTVTTTNSHDMLFGWYGTPGSYGTYTPGTDGQGHTFTQRDTQAGAFIVQTINEVTAAAYYSAGSWTTSGANVCYVFAVR